MFNHNIQKKKLEYMQYLQGANLILKVQWDTEKQETCRRAEK